MISPERGQESGGYSSSEGRVVDEELVSYCLAVTERDGDLLRPGPGRQGRGRLPRMRLPPRGSRAADLDGPQDRPPGHLLRDRSPGQDPGRAGLERLPRRGGALKNSPA